MESDGLTDVDWYVGLPPQRCRGEGDSLHDANRAVLRTVNRPLTRVR